MQKIARDPYRFTHWIDGTPTTLEERLRHAPPLERVDRWQTSSLKRRRRRPQAPLAKMLPKGVERDSDFRKRHGIGEGNVGTFRPRLSLPGGGVRGLLARELRRFGNRGLSHRP